MDLLFLGPGIGTRRSKHAVMKTPVGEPCDGKSGFLLLSTEAGLDKGQGEEFAMQELRSKGGDR